MLCSVEPEAAVCLVEVPSTNPSTLLLLLPPACGRSTFFSRYSMPAFRKASVCVNTVCATFCTNGAEEGASCSATVIWIALVCCCADAPALENLALKECVPERAVHFAETTLLDCAESDTSCDVNFVSSTKKVSVPPTVASVPLYSTVEIEISSPAMGRVFESHSGLSGKPA